jgi:hypothetical protein
MPVTIWRREKSSLRYSGSAFNCPSAISTRGIHFDGSSAIVAAAIKIDIERLKKSARLFRLAPNSDRAVEPRQMAMTTEETEEFRQLCSLANDRDQKHYAWIRHLLLLASGALTALVAFRAGTQSIGVALLFLRIGWVSLGLGILLGAFCLHGEVWTASKLAKLAAQEAIERSRRGESSPSPIFANRPALYRWAEKCFYASLVVAVISLVTHAVLRHWPSQHTVDHRTSADVSDLIEGFVERFAAGKVDLASARCDLSFALDKVEFPWDEDWLNGVLRLNSSLRSSWRNYDWQRLHPVILDSCPAQEFYRAYPRGVHRDWLSRWTKAGGHLYNGKMIALKDDPIWHTLSDFGFPFSPFALRSGMRVRDIKRQEAIDLGLIDLNRRVSPNKVPRPGLILLPQTP